MTTRRVHSHPGWLAVVALAALASVAVSAVLDAGLRVWSTNAGIGTGHIAVIGAPLPGSAIVTVPARPARRHPVPVQQVPAAATPLNVTAASGAAAGTNAPAAVTGSGPARPTPTTPAVPEVPASPPGLLTFVAPLVPPLRLAGVPLGMRALVLRRQEAAGSDRTLLRPAWTGAMRAQPGEDAQPDARTTSLRPWAAGWTSYRQAVRTPVPATSSGGWTAHTWHAWR